MASDALARRSTGVIRPGACGSVVEFKGRMGSAADAHARAKSRLSRMSRRREAGGQFPGMPAANQALLVLIIRSVGVAQVAGKAGVTPVVGSGTPTSVSRILKSPCGSRATSGVWKDTAAAPAPQNKRARTDWPAGVA